VKLTTHLYLVPRSKSDSSNTPSWRGAQLKKQHRDNFTFLQSHYLIYFAVSKLNLIILWHFKLNSLTFGVLASISHVRGIRVEGESKGKMSLCLTKYRSMKTY
jgi:hypothetical protein